MPYFWSKFDTTYMIQTNTLKYGIAAGVAVVLFTLGFYSIDKGLIFNTLVFYGSLVFPLFAMWIMGSRLQILQNIDFTSLLRQVFLLFILSEIVYYSWYYLMVNHLDRSLLGLQQQQMLASYQAIKTNATEMKDIQYWNQIIQDLEKNGLTSIGFGTILLQMGRGIVGGFVLSYAMTFLLNKRNK